jgi:protein involved in temperature-dependent protein secretion
MDYPGQIEQETVRSAKPLWELSMRQATTGHSDDPGAPIAARIQRSASGRAPRISGVIPGQSAAWVGLCAALTARVRPTEDRRKAHRRRADVTIRHHRPQ